MYGTPSGTVLSKPVSLPYLNIPEIYLLHSATGRAQRNSYKQAEWEQPESSLCCSSYFCCEEWDSSQLAVGHLYILGSFFKSVPSREKLRG